MATRTEPTAGNSPAAPVATPTATTTIAPANASPPPSDKLERLAFSLFTQQRSNRPGQHAESTALQCFKDAEAFLAVSGKLAAGNLTTAKPATAILADAHAPNLKPTHPINMVSQKHGNINRLREINAKLQKDPTIEVLSEPDWDKAEVATARAIFPAYVAAADAVLAAAN